MITPRMPETNHDRRRRYAAGRTRPSEPQRSAWQRELRDAVRSIGELARLLSIEPGALAERAEACAPFPLLVPRAFVARMRPGDPDDPLLLQVLPQRRERSGDPLFTADPLGEQRLTEHGVIRKYAGRALIVTTGACPIHCRYCFRREFPYSRHAASKEDWAATIERLRAEPGVSEVILSGGDPLSLSNARIARLFRRLESVHGIDTIRIHTRFPIVIPSRVDEELLSIIGESPLNVVTVVHSNHANEIDAAVESALQSLSHSVKSLLNQSVLLDGINDRFDSLAALSRRLIECRVLPYYLHMLDRVTGSAHFEVGEQRASELIEEMRARLPGYLVPKLVREVPEALSKVPM